MATPRVRGEVFLDPKLGFLRFPEKNIEMLRSCNFPDDLYGFISIIYDCMTHSPYLLSPVRTTCLCFFIATGGEGRALTSTLGLSHTLDSEIK